MAITQHYHPAFAAQGGPPCFGPNLEKLFGMSPGDIISDDTSGGVAVMWIPPGKWCVVHTHTGDVYAEADGPEELLGWMSEYLVLLGAEIASWENA